MLEPQMQVPSPAMGAMDELLARREKALALALVQSAMAQLVEATSLMPVRGKPAVSTNFCPTTGSSAPEITHKG